ncbi:MAG: TVP38/TMEM64 family protein [Lachnospiraceae bacterium]
MMNHKKRKQYQIVIQIISVVGFLLTAAFLIYGYHTGIFLHEDKLKAFLLPLGIMAPLVFMFIQAVQVVVPILPGAIGCVVGVAVFGGFQAFWYNYIGICIGSLLAFLIAQRVGRPALTLIASEKTYNRYIGWLEHNQKTFDKLFTTAIFLPVAPDDFLCYLAGMTKMTIKKFTIIILLGKPLAIAAYSMGLSLVLENIYKMLLQ